MPGEMVINIADVVANPAYGHPWGLPLEYASKTGLWRGYIGGYAVDFSGSVELTTDADGQPVAFAAVLDGTFSLSTFAASGQPTTCSS